MTRRTAPIARPAQLAASSARLRAMRRRRRKKDPTICHPPFGKASSWARTRRQADMTTGAVASTSSRSAIVAGRPASRTRPSATSARTRHRAVVTRTTRMHRVMKRSTAIRVVLLPGFCAAKAAISCAAPSWSPRPLRTRASRNRAWPQAGSSLRASRSAASAPAGSRSSSACPRIRWYIGSFGSSRTASRA